MEVDYSYIDVKLSDQHVGEMMEVIFAAGIKPSDKYDFHATVMYDERDIEKPLTELRSGFSFVGKITGIEVLGDGVVFNLYSPSLVEENKRLRDAGYEHSFNEFMPHMSLTYLTDPNNKYEALALKQAFADWAGRDLYFGNEAYGFKKVK